MHKSEGLHTAPGQQELDSIIAVLYARGTYIAKSLPVEQSWSKKWGPQFFHDTMSRNRFDIKSSRCQLLKTDKFVLASEVWNRFIANRIKVSYIAHYNLTLKLIYVSKTPF